jgi:NosR/NirI family transcriptional regulator, nitrous oxide reductase regulator
MPGSSLRGRLAAWLATLLFMLTLLGIPQGGIAGTMTRATLEPLFPAPLMVGEKSPALAAWPIFRREQAGPQLVGHVFETVDLEPTAGYGGKPINLLVAIDVQGNFLDVRLLYQREPIFQSEKGHAQLTAFAAQYKGLSMRHDVQVGSAKGTTLRTDSRAIINGVTAGTVTALAIDRSIMQSASRVALARLELDDPLAASTRTSPASARGERFVPNGWNELSQAGLVRRIERSNRELEGRFAGTVGAGRDAVAMVQPQGVAIDTWFGLASLPQVGRNLLDANTWEQVRTLRDGGELVFLIFENGRLALGGPALRAVLHQGEHRVELRAVDGPPPGLRLAPPRTLGSGQAPARLWRSVGAQPLDATQTLALELQVVRDGGGAAPQRAETSFTQPYGLADLKAWLPEPQPSVWAALKPAVTQRAIELSVLVLGLLLLVVLLVRQRWVAASTRRLRVVRVAYLVFTLGFIGWVAQGQLTIVTLTSLIEAVATGQGLAFLLADPVTVLLWAFVLVTLVVWGRGTFCGWLCPFGALQELLSLAAQRLHFKPKRLRRQLDARLKWIKYGVLAVLVGGAGMSAAWTDSAVEVEPFKTAISLGFDRAWPFVAWALCCTLLSVFVFRGYCRYVCPLGAALALFGRVRMFAWIPRRKECGTPCQSCRHRCQYEAIAPTGVVDYTECFQCLDCVEIYQDDQRCLPLVVERKHSTARHIPILPARPANAMGEPA